MKAKSLRAMNRSFLSISAAMELARESTVSTAPAAWAVVLAGATAALMAAGPGGAWVRGAGGMRVGRLPAAGANQARRRGAGKEGGGQAAAAAGEWAPTRRALQARASDRWRAVDSQEVAQRQAQRAEAGSGALRFRAAQGVLWRLAADSEAPHPSGPVQGSEWGGAAALGWKNAACSETTRLDCQGDFWLMLQDCY
jgi:hypothetical protein